MVERGSPPRNAVMNADGISWTLQAFQSAWAMLMASR